MCLSDIGIPFDFIPPSTTINGVDGPDPSIDQTTVDGGTSPSEGTSPEIDPEIDPETDPEIDLEIDPTGETPTQP